MNITLENWQSCIDKINQESDTFLVLMGDFNSHCDSANPSECSDFGCLLCRWFECNNLHQVITEPTRVTAFSCVQEIIVPQQIAITHQFIFAKFCISFRSPSVILGKFGIIPASM